mmetsp:Transcript_14552/g.54997  ORF Transcript_14552/g.54997 Transcript_14552/m.54997 type:complete len:207 (+) Transcript_14552:2675-3295(+)
MVPTAEPTKPHRDPGMVPSTGSLICARLAMPYITPETSKMPTKRNAMMAGIMWIVTSDRLMNSDGPSEKSGIWTISFGQVPVMQNSITVEMTILRRTAPGTEWTMRLPARMMPPRAAHMRTLSMCPRPTMVSLLCTTMPTLTKPMRAMSRPMPTTIASFTVRGVMRMMMPDKPVKLQIASSTPDSRLAVSACDIVTAPPKTSPYAM